MENDQSSHYIHFQAEQFAADEAFTSWVVEPTPKKDAFWSNWRQTHPEKESIILEARRLVELVRLQPEQASEQTKSEIWAFIQAHRQPDASFRPPGVWWRRWHVAAAVVLLVTLGLFARYWFWGATEVATAYGETRQVQLPDGSLVTLNGNSTLRYDRHWDEQSERQVSLEGEAFFKVKRKPSHLRFLVHAGPADIVVLGTQFNVQNRRGKTRVLLTEGKVALQEVSLATPPITMQPGQVADILPKKPIQVQAAEKPTQYTAWQEKKLVFDNTSLREVALQVEDTYGVTFRFADSSLADFELQGEVYVATAGDVAEVIAESFGLRYQQQDNTVTFLKP